MKYDVLKIHDQISVLKFEGNQISALKNQNIVHSGLRRFEQGRLYQAARIGEASLDRLLADSREWGGPGSIYDYGFAPSKVESRKSSDVSQDNIKIFKEEVLRLASQFPNFTFNGQCKIVSNNIHFHSDYGIDLLASGGFCDWYLSYQRHGSGSIFDGYVYQTSSAPDIVEGFHRHQDYLKAQSRPVTIKPGMYPVLLAQPLSPLETFLDSIAIQKYYDGSALYSGKLGQTLFSSKITLRDQAYLPTVGHIQFFDGEGTVREDDGLKIIEQGVFKNVISDLRFAKKFNRTTTGNGLRGYNTGVTVGPRNLLFESGTKTWSEIFKNLGTCIVAAIAEGGDSNDLGQYSTPVQVGYVFEKGELVGLAPQLTIKTSTQDYLKNRLVDVASDSFMGPSEFPSVISEMQVMVN